MLTRIPLSSASATVLFGFLLAGASPLFAQLEHSLLDTPRLPSDSRLTLYLHSGDYQIAASNDAQIHVSATSDEKTRPARPTEIHFQQTPAGAKLEIDPPDNNSSHITLSLPACDALDLKLTAGKLVFDTAPCHTTDVSMRAGELRARMPDPDSFRTVRASVSIGEISAPGLGPGEKDANQGGFFRTFKRSGSGSRTFAAHVDTGQITLDGRKQ